MIILLIGQNLALIFYKIVATMLFFAFYISTISYFGQEREY